MIIRRGIINNKELQAAAGNWGKPTKEEHSPHHVAEQPEIAKHRSKKRRPKIDWEARCYGCPFCGKVLPVVEKVDRRSWREPRAEKCASCHARNIVKGCPACQWDIWYLNGIYKHQKSGLGCGFVGKKLRVFK